MAYGTFASSYPGWDAVLVNLLLLVVVRFVRPAPTPPSGDVSDWGTSLGHAWVIAGGHLHWGRHLHGRPARRPKTFLLSHDGFEAEFTRHTPVLPDQGFVFSLVLLAVLVGQLLRLSLQPSGGTGIETLMTVALSLFPNAFFAVAWGFGGLVALMGFHHVWTNRRPAHIPIRLQGRRLFVADHPPLQLSSETVVDVLDHKVCIEAGGRRVRVSLCALEALALASFVESTIAACGDTGSVDAVPVELSAVLERA